MLVEESPATAYRAAQALGKAGANVYEAVESLERKARGITMEDEAAAAWREKSSADLTVAPLLQLDLDTADRNPTRAHDGLLADLTGASAIVEKGLAVRIALPTKKTGTTTSLLPGPALVRAVTPGGPGARRGLRIGDEIHLLDSALYAASNKAPGKPYDGLVRVTREGEPQTVTLAP